MARKKSPAKNASTPTKKAGNAKGKDKGKGRGAAPERPGRKGMQAAADGSGVVLGWEDDPGSGASPIPFPVPDATTAPAFSIVESAPDPAKYPSGTPEFRYWAASVSLRRTADFWGALWPSGTNWQPGGALQIFLDEGEDLNAYYDRRGLNFFHETISGVTYYSGESPDVVCHEMGHAILDSIRPDFWNTASDEVAAFHESFGDMSAILSAIQVPSLRKSVLSQTGGKLYRSSRLSRLAEQLGDAIRQIRPDAVDPDCLRNAVNSFFYQSPMTLPPSAPASRLSSEPHSFSRVFTGGFFEALAGMLVIQSSAGAGPTDDDLLQVGVSLGQLLIDAASTVAVVPDFFSQAAAALIAADATRFNGKYTDAIKSAFVRRGILSLEGAAAMTNGPSAGGRAAARGIAPAMAASAIDKSPSRVRIAGSEFGLGSNDLMISVPSAPKRFDVAPASFAAGPAATPPHRESAKSFVADLFRRGRVELSTHGDARTRVVHPLTKKTHILVQEGNALALVRTRFDCGFGSQLGT